MEKKKFDFLIDIDKCKILKKEGNEIVLKCKAKSQKSQNSKVDIQEEVVKETLPYEFRKLKKLRDYFAVVVADFSFRGIPSRGPQGGFIFGGRIEFTLNAYSLNQDELDLLKERLSESDIAEALRLVEGMTTESLESLKIDIDEFISDKKPEKTATNPFTAILGMGGKKKKPEEEKKEKLEIMKKKGIKSESYAERYLRSVAEANSFDANFSLYDIYKKAHKMTSFPYAHQQEAEVQPPQSTVDKLFGFK